MKDREEMLDMLDVLCDEKQEYNVRLDAYEYLQEECEDIVGIMIEKMFTVDEDTADMLLEVLTEYPGHKEVYLGLVSHLYRGDDVALYARLLGKYGDPDAIELLNAFAKENELNYNEFMEIRNAVEELGGDFNEDEKQFEDDEFYRYIKGLDSPENDGENQ